MLQYDQVEMETDEMKLLDFPNEIVLNIFRNLSDHSLLQVIRVCKRFKIIAETSFKMKYSGVSPDTFYSLKVSGEGSTDEQKQYQLYFRNFGDHMRAIKIDFMGEVVARNHWLIYLIQRYCKSVTKVSLTKGEKVDVVSIICNMPGLTDLRLEQVKLLKQKWTQYPKLVHFYAEDSDGDDENFVAFINHNPQLEHLTLIRFMKRSNNVLYALNGKLNKLKKLELIGDKASFIKKSSTLRMSSLKSLSVRVNANSFAPLLESIRDGFKTIEELTIYVWRDYKLNVRDVELICSFKMLKMLVISDAFELPFGLLKVLLAGLPNLVSFSLGNAENLSDTHDDLLSVVAACQKLTLLELTINPKLPMLNYNFYTRFADIMRTNESNLKLELFSEPDKIVITRDEARYIKDCLDDIQFHIIHFWKGYDAAITASNKNLLELNEKILKKIIAFLNGNALCAFFLTCYRARELVIEHFTENVFRCAVAPEKRTAESVFMVLGQHIRRIEVDLDHDTYGIFDDDEDVEGTESYELKTKFMKCVNQYCGGNLVEMKIESSVQYKNILYWPSLKKLQFSYIDTLILRLFHCPELRHLHIARYENIVNVSIDWANLFPNLTSLKFGFYDDSVETFLSGLNHTICNQINNLSLNGSFKNNQRQRWLKLTNIIVRFGCLATLHLNIDGIEESNYKFLFEKCSMLVELSMFFDDKWTCQRKCLDIFRTIKVNCTLLQVMQLVVKGYNYFGSSIPMIYSMFPKVTFNLIDSKMGKCLCALKKKK